MLDLANPAAPRVVSSYKYVNLGKVGFFGAYACVVGSSVQVFDVSNPLQPKLVGACDTGTGTGANDIAVHDAYVYAIWGDGVGVLDMSDPTQPRRVGEFIGLHPPNGLAVRAPHAYLASGGAGVEVLDVSDPAQPCVIAVCPTASAASRIVLAGNMAYVAEAGPVGLEIIDVGNPAQPRPLGTGVGPGPVSNVAVAGGRAYFEVENAGLGVFDITDPANPQRLRGYGRPEGKAVAVRGQHAYVAAGDTGLAVLDTSQPWPATRVGAHYSRGEALDVCVDGQYAYLGAGNFLCGDGGLEILDLSDPARPLLVGRTLQGRKCRRVTVSGPYAFVLADVRIEQFCEDGGVQTTWVARLCVVDVSVPTQPGLVGEVDAPEATDVVVDGDMVYLVQGSQGVTLWRMVAVDAALRLNPPVVASGRVTLSWLGGPGPRLQRASSLTAPQWQDLPGSEAMTRIELPLDSETVFFRLVGPTNINP